MSKLWLNYLGISSSTESVKQSCGVILFWRKYFRNSCRKTKKHFRQKNDYPKLLNAVSLLIRQIDKRACYMRFVRVKIRICEFCLFWADRTLFLVEKHVLDSWRLNLRIEIWTCIWKKSWFVNSEVCVTFVGVSHWLIRERTHRPRSRW